MPRQARIDAPGALHHIIIRGIDRRVIFTNERDRGNFLERLSDLLTDSQTACYAWALMSNHAHLLLRTGGVSISSIMQRLLTGYAVSFNKRHHRHGHLFQNRYKSILCEEDRYLRQLVAYIHLNPLRARIVEDVAALNLSCVVRNCKLMNFIKPKVDSLGCAQLENIFWLGPRKLCWLLIAMASACRSCQWWDNEKLQVLMLENIITQHYSVMEL